MRNSFSGQSNNVSSRKCIAKSDESPKHLTEEEAERLANEPCMVEFRRQEYEKNTKKNWDRFYKRNSDNFFKDRNWTKNELRELCSDLDLEATLILIEAGCGCGNTIFPLKAFFPTWIFWGIDFSKNAIALLNERAKREKLEVGTGVMDLTDCSSLPPDSHVPAADLISLIFVLSTISADKHINVVRNLYRILKPGGSLIFRDYGVFDHAMLRFGKGSKIAERFYVRQDGTRAHFFYTEELSKIFEECGFQTVKCGYVHRETRNIKEGLCIGRVFVEGRFVRKIT